MTIKSLHRRVYNEELKKQSIIFKNPYLAALTTQEENMVRRWDPHGKHYPNLPFKIIKLTGGAHFLELQRGKVYELPPNAIHVRVGGDQHQARIAFGSASGHIPANAQRVLGENCIKSEKTR